MNIFKRVKNIWKSGDKEEPIKKRSLNGGRFVRYINWINATLTRVNGDIESNLMQTISKCRELAKNDPIVRAYIGSCVKNVIGKGGFALQCGVKDEAGDLIEKLNDAIEWKYYMWGRMTNDFLTLDGRNGA